MKTLSAFFILVAVAFIFFVKNPPSGLTGVVVILVPLAVLVGFFVIFLFVFWGKFKKPKEKKLDISLALRRELQSVS